MLICLCPEKTKIHSFSTLHQDVDQKVLHQSQLQCLTTTTAEDDLSLYFYDSLCLYRIVVIFCVLFSLLCLLLSLQFDLHGVCDQGSEDGVGLG